MTIEDETGIANLIVWPKTFEQFRPVVLGARLIGVTGRLQHAKGVTHLVAGTLEDLSPMMGKVSRLGAPESLARADEVRRPGIESRGPSRQRPGKNFAMDAMIREEPTLAEDLATIRQAMPKGRNFR
jgi:error-prone DNA polymerase